MKRTGPLAALVALVVIVGVAGVLSLWRDRAQPRPYNVLLITLDTTRADRLGCYGHSGARTPSLDRLAVEGTLFERAYCTVPLTLPSHTTILTGLQPPEHGLIRNAEGSLARTVPTLATVLRERGYATGAFIASTVLEAKYGLSRGFDTYDDQLPAEVTRGTAEDPYRPAPTVADPALQWIREHASGRFLCWVHFFDPHWPYYLHEDLFGAEFNDAPYDGEIALADTQVNRLVGALEELGIRERTLVVVVGDHGESLNGEHGEPRPYHGYFLYKPTLHVPLIFSLPGVVARAHRVPEPVSLVDVCRTITDFLRLPGPSNGREASLVAALAGRPVTARACYAETAYPAVYGCRPQQCLITERWKYIRSLRPELYDLETDRAELNNRAAAEPERVREMETALADLERTMTPGQAESVQLTAEERRRLESLGYLGGGASAPSETSRGLTNDIKDAVANIALGMHAEDLQNSGRATEAIAAWREAVAACPGCLTFRNSLAATLMEQGNYAEAEPVLRPLLAELQSHLSGPAALRTGKDEALYPVAAHNLGLSLAYLGRFDEALPLVLEAVELSPDVSAMRFTLANIYERLGRDREALAAAEEAVRQGYAYPDCVTLLAELHLRTGDQSRAATLARAVLEGRDVQPSYRSRAQEVLAAIQEAVAVPDR